ncbi:hypothetical protein E2C01_034371 [Portunus trituberculatus]|uniref:Uncharacterized protein n=1 Tax=Portunus trituberculatus TaxID=210409 RepID=A0A5B7F2P6_PORTR|nr:hypothetical protein [Portunus trituberculatus]
MPWDVRKLWPRKKTPRAGSRVEGSRSYMKIFHGIAEVMKPCPCYLYWLRKINTAPPRPRGRRVVRVGRGDERQRKVRKWEGGSEGRGESGGGTERHVTDRFQESGCVTSMVCRLISVRVFFDAAMRLGSSSSQDLA